jgi:glycyl-tRNA synthetase beta subunit
MSDDDPEALRRQTEALRKQTNSIKAETRTLLEAFFETAPESGARRLTQNEIIAAGREVARRPAPWRLRALMRVVLALPAPIRKRVLVFFARRIANRMQNLGYSRADMRAIMEDAERRRKEKKDK